MPKALCRADPQTTYSLHGFLRDRLERIVEQWLLVAPLANPAMLEMFRDREASPLRHLEPWAGEFAGKYLTSAVQVLRVTGDARLKAWLGEFVALLIRHQAADGYLGPWPEECRLTNSAAHRGAKSAGTWDTWGHYHIMLGLLLWHEQTADRHALRAAARIGDLLCRKYLGQARPRLVDTGWTEMNLAVVHSLALLYQRTSGSRYLKLALQLVEEFGAAGPDGPLAGDYLRQALAGREFFQTPKPRWESLHPILGLVELHWITGCDSHRQAFEHLWWSMVKRDRHNNGGFTSGEKATGNPFDQGAIETCCTIAWIALSVEMLKLTANPVVADEIELSTLNSVIGMHSCSGRWATYDTPQDGLRYASAHQIVFQARAGSPELNCCSVNGPRGFGMLSDWAVLRDEAGILLNYYGPSRMRVPLGRGVTVDLVQETDYPVSGVVELEVSPSRTLPFVLKLRIPYWSQATKVTLNGRPVEPVRPGQYLALERRWRKGDRIRLELDFSLHYWAGERDCEGRTSLYRGPLLLAFDHRYNLHLAPGGERRVRDAAPVFPPKPFQAEWLQVPVLDARILDCKPASWSDWMPPLLLLEAKSADGKRVRLCDFGSAGAAGTPYRTWLPVAHGPDPVVFSRSNPLRSGRLKV